MNESAPHSFSRYLRAKKSVDDRSLDLFVYQKMRAALTPGSRKTHLNIVELGCGLGTMIDRLWNWRLADQATYTALDRDPELIDEAGARLAEFARLRRLPFSEVSGSWRLQDAEQDWLVTLAVDDCLSFCQQPPVRQSKDLLLAHAFLDLVDLATGLPCLLSVLKPGGLYYFTLNYDGQTIFYPPLDPPFEDLLLTLYHQSMDDRDGGRAGHSQTGRRLLAALGRLGTTILAAGSSDWLVLAGAGGAYPADEAYFLHYLLHTIQQALALHPALDQEKFQLWLAQRRRQIQTGELIFIAHQLDVCGRI